MVAVPPCGGLKMRAACCVPGRCQPPGDGGIGGQLIGCRAKLRGNYRLFFLL